MLDGQDLEKPCHRDKKGGKETMSHPLPKPKLKIHYRDDCPFGRTYGITTAYLQQKGIIPMPHPQPKIRSTLKTFLQFQNGEIEIVRQFRAKIAGKESFKGALLRLMKEATKT